jgi:hypothetical protein
VGALIRPVSAGSGCERRADTGVDQGSQIGWQAGGGLGVRLGLLLSRQRLLIRGIERLASDHADHHVGGVVADRDCLGNI